MNNDSTVDMWVVVSTIILVALTIVTLVVNTIVDQPPAEERMIILDNEEVIPVEEPTAPVEEPVSEPVEEEIVINTIEVTTITYTVVKGDSLWKIAGELLDDPTEWPTIWGAECRSDRRSRLDLSRTSPYNHPNKCKHCINHIGERNAKVHSDH